MRLWSIHPLYLDRAGLTAVWREGLLAQAVLRGLTKGYRSHPQLDRFKVVEDPVGALGLYLHGVVEEAARRGYRFDRNRIHRVGFDTIGVTSGQMEYETEHLLAKLVNRDPERYWMYHKDQFKPHPIFTVHKGPVERWERV